MIFLDKNRKKYHKSIIEVSFFRVFQVFQAHI